MNVNNDNLEVFRFGRARLKGLKYNYLGRWFSDVRHIEGGFFRKNKKNEEGEERQRSMHYAVFSYNSPYSTIKIA